MRTLAGLELPVSVTVRSPAVNKNQIEAQHLLEKEEANKAVRNALAAFNQQAWYWTVYAKVRFALYWCTYWLRLKLAIFGVMNLGWDDKRTWRRLAL